MRKRHRIILQINSLKIKRNDKFCLTIPFLNFLPGTLSCIVGSNGSGKTTLIESIVGLTAPQEGVVKVCGQEAHLEIAEVKRAIGFVPDDDTWLIPELTAREYFAVIASTHAKLTSITKINRSISELADKLMFDSFDQQLGSLSHGNKKKVQIIAGLMHDPFFIVVDELRNGLDPVAIKRAEEILKFKQMCGSSIIAATHDLWWAERFADEIIMIRRGHIVLNDMTSNVIQKYGSLENRFLDLYAQV